MTDNSNYTKYSKKNTIKQELLELLENDKEVNDMVGNIFSKLFNKFIHTENSDTDLKKDEEKIHMLEKEKNNLISEKRNLQKQIGNYEREHTKLKNIYTAKVEQFQKEIDDYKYRLDYQKEELRRKDISLKNLESKTEKLQQLEEKYNSIASKFEKILYIHQIYLSIQQEHGTFLRSLFKDNSIDIFFTNGVQASTIDSLWDYIKTTIIEKKNKIEELKQIFFYFFELYNKTYDSPLFEFSDVEIDDKFNDKLHIKVNDYAYSGKIAKIVFDGYYNCNTDEIIKKTLVKVH